MDKIEHRNKYSKLLKDFNITFSLNVHWSCHQEFNIDTLPISGVKIHLSASITNAIKIVKRCIPYLIEKGIIFKVVSELRAFELQNRGLFGFSQIGKLITIYPCCNSQLNECLEIMNLLTKDINSPLIPSDFSYKKSTVVYYRYGAFKTIYNSQRNKTLLTLPSGEVIVDKRNKIVPQGVDIPINDYYYPRLDEIPKRYLIFSVLRKRGKGGVFKVLDTEEKVFKILKEGSYLGELEQTGVDGLDRVYWEKEVLEDMNDEPRVPKIYDAFYVETSFFIVQEFFEGETLESLCNKGGITEIKALNITMKLSEVVKEIHYNYGYIIRDLSFNNIMIDSYDQVKLIDFEFADKKKVLHRHIL